MPSYLPSVKLWWSKSGDGAAELCSEQLRDTEPRWRPAQGNVAAGHLVTWEVTRALGLEILM